MRGPAKVRAAARRAPSRLRAAPASLLAVGLVAGLAACGGVEGEAPEPEAETPVLTAEEQNMADARAAVNAAARVLAAIERGDSALMREAFTPEALVIATRPDGSADTTGVDAQVAIVQGNAGRFVERIWNPSVELSPEGARVSASYDFYTDGEFSHCGVDDFTIVRVDGEPRVGSLSYSIAQPPECEMHPAGPPAGG